MSHKKYRCADYQQFDTLKDARQHAAELSKGVDKADRHITGLIYTCVDCEAFYGIYLPYGVFGDDIVVSDTESLKSQLIIGDELHTKVCYQTREIMSRHYGLTLSKINPKNAKCGNKSISYEEFLSSESLIVRNCPCAPCQIIRVIVKQTAEIIEFPKSRITRTNPGLIESELRRAA